MKPVFQSNDEECMRACLASIFELPLGLLPSFTQDDFAAQVKAVQSWSAGIGYGLFVLDFKPSWLKHPPWKLTCKSTHCIVCVDLIGSRFGHAMVGRISGKGVRVVHDPSVYRYMPDEYRIDTLMIPVPLNKPHLLI